MFHPLQLPRIFASRGGRIEVGFAARVNSMAVVMHTACPEVGLLSGLREGEPAQNRVGLTAAVLLGRDASRGG